MSIDVRKALTTSSGSAIIPEKLDPELQEVADRVSPLRKIFTRIPWSSDAFGWNARTAFGAAAAYIETTTFSANNSTIARRTVNLKMVGANGAVSNLLVATSKDYINALQMEIEGATKSLALKIEELMVVGDETGSVNNAEFDGLEQQITSTVDCEGAVISFDKLDDAIREIRDAGGNPDLIVVANRDKGKLDKLMRALMTINWEKTETPFGVRLQTYQDIPVVGSAYVPTDKDYGATATGDFSIGFVLDTSSIVVPEALPISYEEVSVSTDSKAFRIKSYLALAVKIAEHQRKLINIADPS